MEKRNNESVGTGVTLEPKQVLVVRRDLRNAEGQKIRTGKIVAQAAHGSVKAILQLGTVKIIDGKPYMAISLEDPLLLQWVTARFKKVCVCVNSEEELIQIYNNARQANLNSALITDAGLTEFGGIPTNTVVAIGPGDPTEIDKITGHLPLL